MTAVPTGRPFAAGLSEHPDLAVAVGEAVGQVLERLGTEDGPPDLAVLFVTRPHVGGLEDAAAAVRAALNPGTLIGCAAESIVGGAREVELTPGVSLWAGRTGPVTPLRLTATMTPDGPTVTGWPDEEIDDPSAILLIPDPFSFPTDSFLKHMDEDRPGLPVVGGMASAARQAGANRLVLDGEVFNAGSVGVILGPSVQLKTVVSQGCRPIGNPLVVTKAERNVVYELGGRTALERLGEVAELMPEKDRVLLNRGVHFGRVIDEHKTDFGRGDFLIRSVMGGDPESGAIAVGDLVDVGATAQFQVRDAASADEDLRQLVAGLQADGALLFTCNGRGTNLFPTPNHDAELVSESLDGAPLAGMFCAGEIGPIGGRNFVHGFTASVVFLEVSHPAG